MNPLIEYAKRFEHLSSEFENDNREVDQDVIDLEQDILRELDFFTGNGEDISLAREEVIRGCKDLIKKIKRIKKEYDFYDEDAELDKMFPNRDDEDFDEDSMSYDSVLGDE